MAIVQSEHVFTVDNLSALDRQAAVSLRKGDVRVFTEGNDRWKTSSGTRGAIELANGWVRSYLYHVLNHVK